MLKDGLLQSGKTIRMIQYDDETVFSIIYDWKHTCRNTEKEMPDGCCIWRVYFIDIKHPSGCKGTKKYEKHTFPADFFT